MKIFLAAGTATTGFLLASDGSYILNSTGGRIILNIGTGGGGNQKLINAIVKFRASPRLYNQ
jgi:hypothetical protein